MANANLYHVIKFPLYLSFTVHYFHKKISSFTRFFIHKNCFELFFSCSFSILRNSQLESDVCRLPSTWCLNSLFYSRIRQRKNEANSVFPLATRAVKIGLSSPLGISRVSPTRKRTFSFWMYNKSFIDHAYSVEYLPCSILRFYWTRPRLGP